MGLAVAGNRPPPEGPGGSGTKARVRRRELERQRHRRRQAVFYALLGATVVVVAAGLVVFARPVAPPAAPPGNTGPIISNEPMHIHPHLALFRDAQAATLPEDIGRNPARWVDHTLDGYADTSAATAVSPLHTHDTTGDIHVESRVTRDYTLGEFFAVWGQPIGPTDTVELIPDAAHNLTMTVDGVPSTAWGNLVLQDGQQIEIHYDTVTPAL